MTRTRRADAQTLLDAFLREDEHYLETSGMYGDAGLPALKRALGLFLRRSDLGFVWLAYADREPAAVCVVCYAISTSIGGLVAKLDDVYVAPHLHGRGMSIAVYQLPFWHYTTPMIARPGVDDAWRWLLLASYIIDRKKRRPESHAANEAS